MEQHFQISVPIFKASPTGDVTHSPADDFTLELVQVKHHEMQRCANKSKDDKHCSLVNLNANRLDVKRSLQMFDEDENAFMMLHL